MKKLSSLFLIIFTTVSFAQQYTRDSLDSLYNQYIGIREGLQLQNAVQPGEVNSVATNPAIKCGFEVVNVLRLNIDKFSPDQQIVLRKLLSRPATDTSIISPKGYFRIHFYKSGSEAPNYNVDSLAIAADSSWDFEINSIGFQSPPTDNGAGGDDKYDIYIDNLGNYYGQTTWETEISPGSNRYTSYLEIDNDFPGFYTTGINAARVTVAHEFNHAIQMGDYTLKFEGSNVVDGFFYELTSTSMEIFVFTSIPDYVGYMQSYFYNTDQGFGDHSGYDLAIWNLYLQKNFGYGVIKRQWELLVNLRALEAINTSLTEQGSSFGEELVKFGIWTYYTNYRSVPGQYFSLASKYPLIHSLTTVSLNSSSKSVTVNTTPATNNFVTFTATSLPDTLVALVSNIDYQSGIDNSTKIESFQYTVYTNSVDGSIPISSDYSANLSVTSSANWLNADFLNNQLVNADTMPAPPVLTEIDYAYPSPFYYNINSQIFIPVSKNNNGAATLNVYSSSLNLVFSGSVNTFFDHAHPVVAWKARNTNNEKLATGVYIYVTKAGDNIVKGKLVIFNR